MEAANGQDAMNCLRSGLHFDVALVDWNMPVMTGLEMLETMRGECFEHVKVMMVTIECDSERIMRALQAGADEYLMKPFDGEALAEKLALLGLGEA
jgi:two-component system chemotaxis response regulator CheY